MEPVLASVGLDTIRKSFYENEKSFYRAYREGINVQSLIGTALRKYKSRHISFVRTIFVIGSWKADQNVTLGIFHFIGPANSYTHTVPIYSGITRLS